MISLEEEYWMELVFGALTEFCSTGVGYSGSEYQSRREVAEVVPV